ncbi:MAG: hypothetical protein ITG06_11265 [Planococcus sp. (in: Bacteria)]|nr:hypothetical protein [Planococcus sp. (in: firmicutes)]
MMLTTEQSAEKKLYIWANLNNIMLQKPIMNTIEEYFVSTNKNNYDAMLNLYEPEFQIVSRILEEGINRGEFKEDLHIDDVSVLLYNFITSLANAELFGYSSNQDQKNLYRLAIELIVSGLRK